MSEDRKELEKALERFAKVIGKAKKEKKKT